MKEMKKFNDAVARIIEEDPRYAPDAYDFISKAVSHTAKRLRRGRKAGNQHVTGRELLEGVSDYALRQFGPLAGQVMREWGLTDAKAVGEVVFNMIKKKLLRKSDQDSIADFDINFNFDEVFEKPFQPGEKPVKPPIIA